MINQRPMMTPTRKERLRFDLSYHLRDYRGAVKYNDAEGAEVIAGYIRNRLEKLGGLAARW